MVISKRKQDEIAKAKEKSSSTFRPTCPALEAILYESIPVLDHGFVRVVDYMGDDAAVVQAARVSYGRGTKKRSDDRGLIRYLMRHGHTTPFEMLELKLHVKLPIFVARQWVRHRTASINEYSARYSVLDDEFYVPDAKQLASQSVANRQGRNASLPAHETASILELLKRDAEQSYRDYLWLLNESPDGTRLDPNRSSLARELARINLTLGVYTEWYWKMDLHNLLHFVKLRTDEHAQYEIRVYANEIEKILKRWVPLTYEAFCEYQLNSALLSATALNAVRQMVHGLPVTQETSGLSKSEWSELRAVLRIDD